MALDKDILSVAKQPTVLTPDEGEKEILAAVQPPAPAVPQAQQPLVTGAGPIPTGVLGGLQELGRIGRNVLQRFVPPSAVQQLEQLGIKQPLGQVPKLVDPTRQAAQVGAGITDVAAFPIAARLGGGAAAEPAAAEALETGAARISPTLSRFVQPAARVAGPAAIGATISDPKHRMLGAALGGLGAIAGEALPIATKVMKAVPGVEKGIEALRFTGQPIADKIRQTLLGGKNPAEVPKILSRAVENAYGKAKAVSSKMYDKAQAIADKAGFNLPYNLLERAGAAIDDARGFNLQPGTKKTLDKLETLINSPKQGNFKEIHNQIMDLGEKSSKAYKMHTFTDSTALRNVKNALMDDLRNLGEESGRPDIMKGLEDANMNYRENVAPYHNRGIFGQIIKPDTAPDQAGRILSKAENEKVLEDLEPHHKKLVLHENLKPAMEFTPQGKIRANPAKLWGRFAKINSINPALAERLIDAPIRNDFLSLGRIIEPQSRELLRKGARTIFPGLALQAPTILGIGGQP